MKKNITYTDTITVTGGKGSTTTADFLPLVSSGARLKAQRVIPPLATTNYDFIIENSTSREIYKKKNRTGDLNDNQEITVAKGTLVLKIENADDGVYNVELLCELNW